MVNRATLFLIPFEDKSRSASTMKVDLCVLHIRSGTERLRVTARFRSLSDISIPTTVGKSIGMPMQRRSASQAKRRPSWHYRATAGRIGKYRRGLTSHTRAARYFVSEVIGKRVQSVNAYIRIVHVMSSIAIRTFSMERQIDRRYCFSRFRQYFFYCLMKCMCICVSFKSCDTYER